MPRTKVTATRKRTAKATSVNVKIHKTSTDAIFPEKAHPEDAAYDLCASEATTIESGHIAKIKTGLRMEIPPGWKGEIYSRSGLASRGLFVANQPGKIDSNYRGEILVPLLNATVDLITVQKGAKVAQFEVSPTYMIEWEETEDLSRTDRGDGGFGSTDEIAGEEATA